MIYTLLKLTHLLSVILWIGGMAFSQFFLQPALSELAPPVKVRLMLAVLTRFLNTVLVLSTLTVLSGGWMLGRAAKQAVRVGGEFNMSLELQLMAVLGILMWLAFGHIRFVLYKRLQRSVQGLDWSSATACLGKIRQWVFLNLCLGLTIVVVVVIGVSS